MHISWSSTSFTKKFKCLAIHHTLILFGLSSISWCGHQIHIALPTNRLLDSGVDASVLPWFQDLLGSDLILPFSTGITSPSIIHSASCGAIFLGQVAAHHHYLGIAFVLSSIVGQGLRPGPIGQAPRRHKQSASTIGYS